MCSSEFRDLSLIAEASVTSAGRRALWLDTEALEGVTRDDRGQPHLRRRRGRHLPGAVAAQSVL